MYMISKIKDRVFWHSSALVISASKEAESQGVSELVLHRRIVAEMKLLRNSLI